MGPTVPKRISFIDPGMISNTKFLARAAGEEQHQGLFLLDAFDTWQNLDGYRRSIGIFAMSDIWPSQLICHHRMRFVEIIFLGQCFAFHFWTVFSSFYPIGSANVNG